MRLFKFRLSQSLLWLLVIIIPSYGAQFCAQNHIFLVSNGTDENGTTLTYTNTYTQEVHNVTFEGHYLPSTPVCGQRNGRCGMITLFNSDRTILAAVVPLADGVGLVSYQSADNISMVYRDNHFLSYSGQNCVPAFFPPFPVPDPVEPVFGYCLDLQRHRIDVILVRVNFEILSASYFVVPVTNYIHYDFQSNTLLSNFLFFSESVANCFTLEVGRTIFLMSSNLVDHHFSGDQYLEIGSINVPACSASEPRLQSLLTRTECKLAAYCNGTAALFNVPESFGEVIRFPDNVFFCSPNFYVRFLNNSLSVRRVGTDGEQVSGSVLLDAEAILFGDCLTSEEPFYFVASLSDARTVFINFTDLSISMLGENTNPMLVPYTVVNELLFVNNETHSLVYNWTRMCPEDILVVPTNFDLVHSFSGQSLSRECGCIQDTVTTNQMETSTFAASTEQPTNPLSPRIGLSASEIAGIVTGIAVAIVTFILTSIILFVFVCQKRRSSNHGRDYVAVPAPTRDNKRELNEQNNRTLDDLNNAEQETTLSEKECAARVDPDPSIGEEETRTDQEQAELIPGTPLQSNLSANFSRVVDQSENLLAGSEKYPVNTVATSQPSSPDLRDNDHQFVTGVNPSASGIFAATVNGSTDEEHVTDPAPSLCTASPNHVPVPRDNRNAKVNAVPECDTNDPQSTSDLVRPPATWPNRQSHTVSGNGGHESAAANLPNGLGPRLPNNDDYAVSR